MRKVIALDPRNYDLKRMIRRRRMMGGDRYDEVWNGVYVMGPDADNQHQRLATKLATTIICAVKFAEDVAVLAGVNVTDQLNIGDWTKTRPEDGQTWLI